MMTKMMWASMGALMFGMAAAAAEYHVAKNGDDAAAGTAAKPWCTIQRAADVAVAGDVVTIHAGVYREWVRPQNAGRKDAPIVYQAAKGEKVVVTGADPVKGWTKRSDGLWSAKVGYQTFCGMNPFNDIIFGNWFTDGGKKRYRTRLVQNGKPLELHGAEVFQGGVNAGGQFLINIAGLSFGERTLPGTAAVKRTGPRDGFDTQWGKEIGWITEGATCVYEKVDLTTPAARELQLHYSSMNFPTCVEFYDADRPQTLLAKVDTKATGDWRKYATVKSTLPATMAGVKNLLLCFRYVENVKDKLPAGHAALVPGMVTGTIYANFAEDPNVCVPELVTRPACFYPTVEFRDYQTLRGITFENAGPNWAPPTSEQVGVVGTNWSRGWVIEDCTISGSSCSGITLGKYGDEYDNFSDDSQRYTATISRAVENGFDRVGHHTVRRCRIFDCGQVGICGSLGAVFSTVEDCEISYCFYKKTYAGAEMGGIKIHGAVDFTVQRCKIHHCGWPGAIWFDWMAQGARVKDCTFWANQQDVYCEVDHGPILFEGCDFLSPRAFSACSQSIAFVGNRILGSWVFNDDGRRTPIFKPHTVTIHTLDTDECKCGAHVFINNILGVMPTFKRCTHPSRMEDNWMVPRENWKVDEATGKVTITPPAGSNPPAYKAVTGERLGKSLVIQQEFPEPSITRPACP